MKEEIEKDREYKWRRKTLHGKWPETLNKVSSETSRWLQTAQLKTTNRKINNGSTRPGN